VLAILALRGKVRNMNSNWAEENLRTIRTLMERSAVYRRALAPIMLTAGALGVTAAIIGVVGHVNSARLFGELWLITALVALAAALLIARRQALKDNEAFWSPPTRRVALALVPPLLAGMFIGTIPVSTNGGNEEALVAAIIWILFYGCALHAAGFFMPRGIRFFGWLFLFGGCGLLLAFVKGWLQLRIPAHGLMGLFFGVLHLAYGAYLYLTEKGNNGGDEGGKQTT
jgi:hypothetical protein